MSLKNVNLNLLPVLRELLRLRSVTAAGRAVGRSPSAVSEGLAQLRLTFRDPLLVRVQGRMELTPRAQELIAPVELACSQVEELFETSGFDPLVAVRTVVIATHDYHVFSIGPDLVRHFQAIAPGITLRYVDIGPDLSHQLASRAIDLAVMPDFHLGDLASARLLHAPLTQDATVVMMREDHPLAAREQIVRCDLEAYEHVAYHPNWEPVDYRKAIVAFRRHLPVRVRTAQVTMVPFFLIGSDSVALAPERLASRLGPALGLTYRSLAAPELPVHSVLAWSQVLDADPAHRWLREQIIAAVGPL